MQQSELSIISGGVGPDSGFDWLIPSPIAVYGAARADSTLGTWTRFALMIGHDFSLIRLVLGFQGDRLKI
jgi:hypothetical protein